MVTPSVDTSKGWGPVDLKDAVTLAKEIEKDFLAEESENKTVAYKAEAALKAEVMRVLIAHAQPNHGQVTACDMCKTRVLVPMVEQFLCVGCSDKWFDGLRRSEGMD